jgi:crotonobetainyl-CoA:carnitine CoA-transferase CaiB-like acyl-CoA transferase
MSRLLTGQVEDLSEPPLRPVGKQSAFIAGLAAACAGMHAAMSPQPGAVVDVSMHEALATLAMTELTRAGVTGKSWGRRRVADGNGATVTILPASDGYVAISPREERQWASWLTAMGSPAWGGEPRFARKADRVANWDALHALMCAWSRRHDKRWIAAAAQEAHVPSFPLCEVGEHLDTPQLRHRNYYRPLAVAGRTVQAPGAPFGLSFAPSPRRRVRAPGGELPLSGVRVLDFSWVIAGPTTTRYLAAMGAEVIKVEAPGAGDPGRQSELHTVLGQAKKGIVLDLKQAEGIEIARALAARSDLLIENYATGVMDRLGLGAEALRAVNPALIYLSASGMGRTGPDARAVAYGTLLQSYTGFAGLNRHPGVPPRVGFAWADPMCALMLAFVAAAALWQRERTGRVARIDFSMIEAMLWTLAEPLLATQLEGPPQPMGNASRRYAPHGAYRCAGEDDWLAIAVRDAADWRALCALVPGLEGLAALDLEARRAAQAGIDAALNAWTAAQHAADAQARLLRAGIPAAALARSGDLVKSGHLAARAFWDPHTQGVLPGLPWRASFGRAGGPAPGLGADTEPVLRELLGYSEARIAGLRAQGVLG